MRALVSSGKLKLSCIRSGVVHLSGGRVWLGSHNHRGVSTIAFFVVQGYEEE